MVFHEYAQYYDLLYRDKDYAKEAAYVHGLLKKYSPKARTLLDLGCGTGKHAALLHGHGYRVHGIDQSNNMLDVARAGNQSIDGLMFSQGSLQDFSVHQPADAATALFHVMSYQITDESVETALEHIGKNLLQGGILLFDCWYGPAVLFQKPEIRVKRMENEDIRVTRIAEPVLHENSNTVDIGYDVFIEDKQRGKIHEIYETHTMRYFFLEEWKYWLKNAGYTLLDCFEFLTDKPLGRNTWGSCYAVRKI